MSTENQNLAGKLAALAQKNGSKPLVKIIAGVCAGIIALVALCSIFGDSKGNSILKESVFIECDPTITFEEAVNRYCKEKSERGSNYFEDPKEFIEKADKSLYRYGGPFNTFDTTCGEERRMESACVFHAFVKTRKAIWDDAGETSTGVRNVSVKFVDEGEVWIDVQDFSDSARKKLATQDAAFYLPSISKELYEKQRHDWHLEYGRRPNIDWSVVYEVPRKLERRGAIAVYYLAYLLSERSEKLVSSEDMMEFLKAAAKDDEAKMKEILGKVWGAPSTEKELIDGISWCKTKAEEEGYYSAFLKRFQKRSSGPVNFDEVITSEDIGELCTIFSSIRKELKKKWMERAENKKSDVRYFRVKGRKDVFTIKFHVYPDGRVSTEETDKLKEVYGK